MGVDDMDLFKGIELKLMAVERVLQHHPEWRGKLVLIQVTNAPRYTPALLMIHAFECAKARSLLNKAVCLSPVQVP